MFGTNGDGEISWQLANPSSPVICLLEWRCVFVLKCEAECIFVICALKLMQMSGIKRIVPRLTSMAFKMKFQDLVNEIKPVSKTLCTLATPIGYHCLFIFTDFPFPHVYSWILTVYGRSFLCTAVLLACFSVVTTD